MPIVLPKKKLPAITQDPKNMILYGLPKIGKTTILSTLEDCIIIDIEDGSDFVEALKVKIHSLAELKELCLEIKKDGNPYKFAAIDTVTTLEEFAKPLALANYKKSPAGATYEGDILQAPMGSGR
jgi:replication-associated recombination protein RarA